MSKGKKNDQIQTSLFCYLCVGSHYWGRGKTIEEAKAEWKRNSGKPPVIGTSADVYVIIGDDKARVDDMGRLQGSDSGGRAVCHQLRFK
jgi:hypothetical protein